MALLSSAIDLVLLGVIPVIVLAVLTDALFDLLDRKGVGQGTSVDRGGRRIIQ
ncbi:hypothetical protein [Escherichia coli]|uniref:hypothetical protein n=1 Tax=Escherichia coli TaxID=562 RepID=UPI0015C8B696|nr:hypothetical protein [Escherichia coli]NYQ86157.1 hypothetical protein [Escherichia coli]